MKMTASYEAMLEVAKPKGDGLFMVTDSPGLVKVWSISHESPEHARQRIREFARLLIALAEQE